MIHQSGNTEEPKKDPHSDTDERECQSGEIPEIATGFFEDDEDLDPADFFEPGDLRP